MIFILVKNMSQTQLGVQHTCQVGENVALLVFLMSISDYWNHPVCVFIEDGGTGINSPFKIQSQRWVTVATAVKIARMK